MVRISRLGFLRLLATMRGPAGARARFGAASLGELWKVYGGRGVAGQGSSGP